MSVPRLLAPLPARSAEAEGVLAGSDLYARSAVLMDGDSGRILYGKEEDLPLPMASTTKIMTCIVALEAGQGDDQVCAVSAKAAAQPEVKLGMVQGDSFYLKDLLYSLMLESHNDTAVCVAESVGGSVEGFAALMNQKASELGCSDTYYITPNGLDAEDPNGFHHTTAAELARVMRYCITQSPASEKFLEITRTDSYTFENIKNTRTYSCVNHNAFLHMMDGALTGKTGFTGKAGYCYVGAVRQGDKLLIVSLLACGWPNNKRYKWSDTKKLMEYGFANYEKRVVASEPPAIPDISVSDGKKPSVPVCAQTEPFSILARPDEEIICRVDVRDVLAAPVGAGDVVGKAEYLLDGEVLASCPVTASEAVEEIDYLFCLQKAVKSWLL